MDDEVHVWRASLDSEPRVLGRFEATLAADEKFRANRFLFDRDRNHFVSARGILRELLGAYLQRSPADLKFAYGPQGKPMIVLEHLKLPIHFNISHSHGLGVFAFAGNREVGIDLELIQPSFAFEGVASHCFSAGELTELRATPQELRTEAFFLCWTLKEAYLKARGDGLQIPLDSFSVSITSGQPERLQATDSDRWSLRSMLLAPRFVAAIVAHGKDWRLRYFQGERVRFHA
jgi:4'-phosphopantetheinyl transferase